MVDMSPLMRTRLEKAAADCGFELSPVAVTGGLALRSAQFPESVTVRVLGDDRFSVAASVPGVLVAPAPEGAGIEVQGWATLYELLSRAAATARTRPARMVEQFANATVNMPQTTEAERLVVQRVGQDLFRRALLDYWQGRCCVTGLAVPELLRASHIRPWAQCETDAQRLDVFNGLLLSPHLDALFDGGWVSFTESGDMLVSPALPAEAVTTLGLAEPMKLAGLRPEHNAYLEFHRANIFRA